MGIGEILVFVALGLGVIMLLVVGFMALSEIGIWFQARVSRCPVSFFQLIGMRLRKINRKIIVNSKIMGHKAGVQPPISYQELEAHYLAGGSVPTLIKALVAAQRANIPLNFERAAAIDLAGRNVLEAVQTSVHPKVIECPNPQTGKSFLSAIAKNGVELRVRARVTVRTNLDQLIGGATEETVIARVGEGILTSIGSSADHSEVMENPNLISRAVLDRGLDSQTAYEIVSIDIADIDVGENIGARLSYDQAEADVRVARAKAEERKSFAHAREQEMKAAVAENRAKVVLAEAEVPMAMASAFRDGNLETITHGS